MDVVNVVLIEFGLIELIYDIGMFNSIDMIEFSCNGVVVFVDSCVLMCMMWV